MAGFINRGNRVVRAGGFAFVKAPKFGLQVINKSGTSIAKDKLVAVTTLDVTSGRPKIVLADADVAAHENVYVTDEAIANNGEGVVYQGGMSAANLDTSSVTTAGDEVFLDTTAGGFTATAPTGPAANQVPVGLVIVKSSTVGSIFWYIKKVRRVGSGGVQLAQSFTTLAGDGAIALAPGYTYLTKGSAAAVTVAAPGAAMIGVPLTILGGSDFAHIVTFTGSTLHDGTTGASITWTSAAFQGSALTVVGVTATKWNVVANNLGVIA